MSLGSAVFFDVFGQKCLTWNNNNNNKNKRRREREKERKKERKKEREDFADADLYSKTLIAHARSNKPACI